MVFKTGISGNAGGQRKFKPFYDALRLEIAACGDDQRALRRVANALLDRAATGDVAAISALADRLDGKVPQASGGSDELGPTCLHISWQTAPRTEPEEVEVAVTDVVALAAPVSRSD